MAVSGGPKIITDGLVLHLDAANRKSYAGTGSSWVNMINNNYSATLFGATFITDNLGAIDFNHTQGDYATLPDIDTYSANATFTIEMFVKAIGGNWGRIYTNGSNGIPGSAGGFINNDILVLTNSSKPYLYVRIGNSLIFSEQITTQNWSSNPILMYIGISVDKGLDEGRYYIKFDESIPGLIQPELSSTFNPGNSTSFVENRLGGETDNENFSSSDLYQFSIYNRALTESELRQNFNASRRRYKF